MLRPHDCRRVFASEHLNNNTPIHVIQALLGHASPNTVMVYAKLYPTTLVNEYRKTVRATYLDAETQRLAAGAIKAEAKRAGEREDACMPSRPSRSTPATTGQDLRVGLVQELVRTGRA